MFESPRTDRYQTINHLLHTRRLGPLIVMANLVILATALCSEHARAAVPVATETLTVSESYVVTRRYGGEARARRESTLGFRHSGELEWLAVDEGDHVDAGDLLARLDADLLEAQRSQAEASLERAEADLVAARAARDLAHSTHARLLELADAGHVSVQRLDETRMDLASREAGIGIARASISQAQAALQRAEADLDRASIRAPWAGRVQQRFFDEGAMLLPGQGVLRLMETNEMEARVGVPGDVARDLIAGPSFRLTAGARILEGQLRTVLPEVDPTTRTRTAIFTLNTARIAAGTVVTLELERNVAQPGYWVPLAALTEAQRGLWGLYVVVPSEAGMTTQRRLVEVIHTEGDRVFVTGTLRAGENIVASGTERIVPGQPVAAAR